ncbi:hypothetical protein T440DRAFT_531566 [Plenodomus tracheiphilus IPT5]|uniref:Fungal N-terminal domain-containing protein n=1 Tax=Plenodomus tracheiphilus IPT5 TaxID=1408161 RepID=A0A6A7BLG6_9PLEO|nr:hypothetical protein T440DRAFT_531566 [Plenodomus tracheiphilus IPT5]
MEALGAGLAIASLTLQLVDGIERFQAFRDESRDPTIRLQDLVCQLQSVRCLLEQIEMVECSAGYKGDLANAGAWQYELDKSKMRLGELTSLISKYEAGSCVMTGKGGRRRVRIRNYIKIYAKQKKIRQYAEKLDRTRAVVHDYFNITILSQISEIQYRQRTSALVTNMPLSNYDYQNSQLVCNEHDPRSGLRSGTRYDSKTTDSRKQVHAPKVVMAATEIIINHCAGEGTFNMRNTQNFEQVLQGAKVTMIKQTFNKKRFKKSTIPRIRNEVALPSTPNEVVSTSGENNIRRQNLGTGTSRVTINATAPDEDMTYNTNQHQEFGSVVGEIIMIEQSFSKVDVDEPESEDEGQ